MIIKLRLPILKKKLRVKNSKYKCEVKVLLHKKRKLKQSNHKLINYKQILLNFKKYNYQIQNLINRIKRELKVISSFCKLMTMLQN